MLLFSQKQQDVREEFLWMDLFQYRRRKNPTQQNNSSCTYVTKMQILHISVRKTKVFFPTYCFVHKEENK